jgi:hypothetical protein
MVGCDYEGCEREWFHLECAGLGKAPTGKSEVTSETQKYRTNQMVAKWYCNDCKKKLKGV